MWASARCKAFIHELLIRQGFEARKNIRRHEIPRQKVCQRNSFAEYALQDHRKKHIRASFRLIKFQFLQRAQKAQTEFFIPLSFGSGN